jgi:signal transduction histidine kinase
VVSLRGRLTALYGGLFLLAGVMLLMVNYLLVRSRLPDPAAFAQAALAHPGASGENASSPAAVLGAVSGAGGTVSSGTSSKTLNMVFGLAAGEYRHSALSTLLLQSAIALMIMAVLAAVLGWFTAGRALRPLHAVTSTARRFGAQDLHRRINLGGPADELKELADTFDEMLERLAVLFDAQRRFAANASHELRTPLAIQRTLVEVAMSDPDAPQQVQKLGEQLLDANKDSELLIEGLLVLAQSDRGLEKRTPVRLDELAAAVLDRFTEQARARDVQLSSALQPCTVAGDAMLVERLMTNLIQNGIAYNVPGGAVRVEVGLDTPILVSNTGPEVPAEAVEGLFTPFRRLMPDRTADTHNAGLGLSIVRSVAVAHGGSVDAKPGSHGGLVVSVRLPVLVASDV